MDAAEVHSPLHGSLKGHPHVKARLREFCRTDNITNFFYLAEIYLILLVTIGATILFYQSRASLGLSFWWNIPITALAVVIIGASQHQLAGATHEATHHTLFKNRWLNELVSDWLCMFPLFSSTYSFRLYHLVHHQFINDPERDPDFALLSESGHWLDFPVSHGKFAGHLLRQFFLVGLIRYTLARFRYNALGVGGESPYRRVSKGSKVPGLIAFSYLGILLPALWGLRTFGNPALLVAVPVGMWACLALVLTRLPERHFESARIRPVYSRRYLAISRLGFITLLFTTLTTLKLTLGVPAWGYFLLLWVLPLFTTFSYFMILRQVVQHGNGDRGWITNTRVFLVNRFVRYAVFPFGMDYHTPHHMYATIPHYRLPAFHAFLAEFPEYRDECVVVENYVIPKAGHQQRKPTVVEVLGPAYAPTTSHPVYVDDSVLDGWEVDEKEEILKHRQAATAGSDETAHESAPKAAPAAALRPSTPG